MELTRTEYQLLELLMLNPRRVLPHSVIYDRVWGYDFGPTSNALRVYIGYLRRKLEQAGARRADPHGPRRGLRAARAVSVARTMTLRTRIAAVASVSVALAVLAAAIGLYVAVRSDLRGEVDSALRSRAHGVRAPAASGRPRRTARAARPAGALPAAGADDERPGGFPGSVEPAPFGAASGYVQFVSPQGRSVRARRAGRIAGGRSR